MAKGKGKGGEFERLICGQLSRWWTRDKQDDVFWRTAVSGARATIRRNKGVTSKQTQAGDICAVDPIGSALMRVLTFELKTGYKGVTVQDMIDSGSKSIGAKEFEKWLQQAISSCHAANSYAWALIVRRFSKVPVIYIAGRLYSRLARMKTGINKVKRQIHVISYVPDIYKDKKRIYMARNVSFVGMPLDVFFASVKPESIREIAKWWREECKLP